MAVRILNKMEIEHFLYRLRRLEIKYPLYRVLNMMDG